AFGFTVSGEELSGLDALRIAARALRHGEIDAALVGAVDLSEEPVHRAAAGAVLPADRQRAGDAAVTLVVKRLADARRDGDRIYAVLDPEQQDATLELSLDGDASPVSQRFGHAHAASGLLHIAAAAVACASASKPTPNGAATPWLPPPRSAKVTVRSFSGQADTIGLTADSKTKPFPTGHTTAPILAAFAGEDRKTLMRQVREGTEGGFGAAKLAVVAADPDQLAARIDQALALLETPCPSSPADGIHYRDQPIDGDLAYVFTGAAAAYRGMGRDLLTAFPDLGQQLIARHPILSSVAEQVYEVDPSAPMSPFDQLKGSTLLCQAHALLAQSVLGLRPHAALGLSSGETNALFAFGAWRDMDVMFQEIAESGMYGEHLTGNYQAATIAWDLPADQEISWRNCRLLALVADVETAIADEPRVTVTIINAPDDCVIGGDAEACDRVLDRVGRHRAVDLGHDMVVHCAELAPFAETWRRIHDRHTDPVDEVRFYSNAVAGSYQPDRATVAEALTSQALNRVDLRQTLETAWGDGVRVFLELGPRNVLTGAVGQTLDGKEHLALAMDQQGQHAAAHLVDVAAQLFVAGVEVDLESLRSSLPPTAKARDHGRMLHLPAHPPPVRLPPRQDRPGQREAEWGTVQTMEPAPALPSVAVSNGSGLSRSHSAADRPFAGPTPPDTPVIRILRQTTDLHEAFIAEQTCLHQEFLSLQGAGLRRGLERAFASVASSRTTAKRAFSRAELVALASGKISDIFGPQFQSQDDYHRQVRMPEPPLLLADRVTDIEGEPGSMGLGTIWTETDVTEGAWYLHHGRMPPGILIECGQADLLLISWLGVDSLNLGERVYRLLGCELTFHEGGMPRPGEILRYDIHVDGHAKTGDVRLFFFHYDCRNRDRPVLSVRNGQAGFFTDEELAGSSGVLWDPADDAPKADARLDSTPRCTTRRQFDREQVDALVAGNAYACFGEGFEMAAAHQRTPTLPSGPMHLFESVPIFDPRGGPWARGYLRAESCVDVDHWFYAGHFKNDPCMPGTLMADAAVQALAFTMAALGFTITRDGWRFEPVPEEPYKFVCRGQVVPDRAHILHYEVFVEEVIDGPQPTVYAALLCSSDGFKVFHCRRFGLRLVPDWPLSDRREMLADAGSCQLLRNDSDVRGDYGALLACAWGAPSEAFGGMYRRFDRGRRVPRLPGPPYHCISRITAIDGAPGVAATDTRVVEAEFDVLPDAWYFAENGHRVMPFSVLMEVLLQPCGWLASYSGFAITDTTDLAFRNLDGDDAVAAREVTPHVGVLRTKATLTQSSRVGAMTIVFFRVECTCDDGPVLAMNTSFGFFDEAALANQVGLATDDDALALRDAGSDVSFELAKRPVALFGRAARIAGGRLRMIDAITGYWPDAGTAGLGRIRGLQRIDPNAWYFKAHFYQDPVQPGSLGIDALIQLLQTYMLLKEFDKELDRPRFEAIALNQPLVWKYRGQVLPTNREVITELEITRIEYESASVLALAKGSLWVDGLRIYEVTDLGMRMVGEPADPDSILLDPAEASWIGDHRPTYTVPALPLTFIVEYLAVAAKAAAPDLKVVGLQDVRVLRWVTIEQRIDLRTEVTDLGDSSFNVEILIHDPA
ncbi:MAG: acyltransferase domain-containing protein, partial [Pseudomonadota bacterium]